MVNFLQTVKKYCLNNRICAGEAYRAYFGILVGDQGKRWAPLVIIDYCCRTLKGWLRVEKKSHAFCYDPYLAEPSNHLADYSFFMVYPTKQKEEKMYLPWSIPTFQFLLNLSLTTECAIFLSGRTISDFLNI